MKVTLELSRGDIAELQGILADDIARMNKKRNSGRVTPGQIFLLHGQQELLVRVNRQLLAAATAGCPRLSRPATRKEAAL